MAVPIKGTECNIPVICSNVTVTVTGTGYNSPVICGNVAVPVMDRIRLSSNL